MRQCARDRHWVSLPSGGIVLSTKRHGRRNMRILKGNMPMRKWSEARELGKPPSSAPSSRPPLKPQGGAIACDILPFPRKRQAFQQQDHLAYQGITSSLPEKQSDRRCCDKRFHGIIVVPGIDEQGVKNIHEILCISSEALK